MRLGSKALVVRRVLCGVLLTLVGTTFASRRNTGYDNVRRAGSAGLPARHRRLQQDCQPVPAGWVFNQGLDVGPSQDSIDCGDIGAQTVEELANGCLAIPACLSFSLVRLENNTRSSYCYNKVAALVYNASATYMNGPCYGTYLQAANVTSSRPPASPGGPSPPSPLASGPVPVQTPGPPPSVAVPTQTPPSPVSGSIPVRLSPPPSSGPGIPTPGLSPPPLTSNLSPPLSSSPSFSPPFLSPGASQSSTNSPDSSSSSSTGVIVGAVVGGVVLVGAIAGLGIWAVRRKAAKRSDFINGWGHDLGNLGKGAAAGIKEQGHGQAPSSSNGDSPSHDGFANEAALAPAASMPALRPAGVDARRAPLASNDGVAVLDVRPAVDAMERPNGVVSNGVRAPGASSSHFPAGAARVAVARALSVALAGSGAIPAVDQNLTAAIWERKLKTMTITWDSIKIDDNAVLGEGGFGTVYKGMWQDTIAVAVKTLKMDRLDVPHLEALRREAVIMCDMHHPAIAPVYGLVDDGVHHALVMRFYKRGSLAGAMCREAYNQLSLAEQLKMACQVASGMLCLHARKPAPVIHGDLKASNLLINDDGRSVVIADFGLACCLREGQSGQVVESGALTLSISPPEVLRDPSAPRTTAGDVYAFGVLLMEMMTGRPAFRGMSAENLKRAVIGGARPTIPSDEVPPDVASLITDCWAQDPAARPGFAAVLMRLNACVASSHQDLMYGTRTNTMTVTTLADLTRW